MNLKHLGLLGGLLNTYCYIKYLFIGVFKDDYIIQHNTI